MGGQGIARLSAVSIRSGQVPASRAFRCVRHLVKRRRAGQTCILRMHDAHMHDEFMTIILYFWDMRHENTFSK